MRIVEYNNSYAAQVAVMWNKSNSNWGNGDGFKKAEDVIKTESSSGNIKLYLALDNDEVVGYCSLSEYKHDEGASYLPLLNVTPEYHGKGVGKALILTVLKDAINTKWSRFDLFTWSGNIKAMPLYKKCGFFWERRNNTVHLMNFIPYLYQSEALVDYLNQIDWYKDGIRELTMEQDGIERNDFEFYRYDFKNDTTSLAFEFEKTGRGLRYIDTPDYTIEMDVSKPALVFESEYEVTFNILNKKEKRLNIEFKGINNKNIEFKMMETLDVVGSESLTGKFYINETSKIQNKGKTHPVVEALLTINGKTVTFKTGIETKFPVDLKWNVLEYDHVLGKSYKSYLDIENNSNSTETITISLPNNELVTFDGPIAITMDPLQKKSVEVPYSLLDYGFYKEKVSITIGDKTVLKEVSSPLKGSNKSFTGMNESMAYLVSGSYVFFFNKDSNTMAIKSGYHMDTNTAFFPAQIGLPYSLEFNNARPIVTFVDDFNMTITFTSNAFNDVQLIVHVNHIFGLLSVKYELLNLGDKQELSLSVPIWHDVSHATVPYSGKLLEIQKSETEIDGLDDSLVDENWLYNRLYKYGFSWNNDVQMKISEWKMTFDFPSKVLDTNESFISSTFYCSFVHKDVKAFRKFTGNTMSKEKMSLLDVVVNNGNPFVKDDMIVGVVNHKKAQVSGTFTVDGITKSIDETSKVKPGSKKIDIELRNKKVSLKKVVHEITGEITSKDEDGILSVDNGVINFKASNAYADSIFSLQFNGHEWLDSNYPKPAQRAWWADFVGGITQRVSGIQDIAALKEDRTNELVSLTDNFGNEWHGIKISLSFKLDPILKGIVVESYSLTLPGVPVLHTFTNVINNSGKLLLNKEIFKFYVLNLDDNKKSATVLDGDITYKCGDVSVDIELKKLALFESTREHKLAFYNKKNTILVETQTDYNICFSETNVTIPDGESKLIDGDFIVFTKEVVTKESLGDLENIKFEV